MLAALAGGRGPTDHPVRYLMVAVRTAAFNLHNQRRRSDELVRRLGPDTSHVSAEEPADEHLAEALATLSPRWRQVIWWAEVEGRTPADIGERLGLSPNAASALTYRARRSLRAAYRSLAAGEDRHRTP